MKKLRHSWLALVLAMLIGLSLLISFSSKAGSLLLMEALESSAIPLTFPVDPNIQAIVVIGGGTEREWYAAKLQRETGLPLLVSGEEAIAMAKKITKLNAHIQWMEENSHTTEENAEFSANILRQNGVHRILLVTNANHMLRARMIFKYNGFAVIAAPVTFSRHEPLSILDFMPSSRGLEHSRAPWHELLGILWFWISTTF